MARMTSYRMVIRSLDPATRNKWLHREKLGLEWTYEGVKQYAINYVRQQVQGDCYCSLYRSAGPFADVEGYILKEGDEVVYTPRRGATDPEPVWQRVRKAIGLYGWANTD